VREAARGKALVALAWRVDEDPAPARNEVSSG
jgi:hypothetical protein